MPLSINTNIASLTAQRAMLNTGRELETAFERLSTGKRVNTAVDDAAGLAIAERLTGRINGLNQAIRNASDGVSVVQIAEGAQDEVTTIIQRLRDLAVQGANSSLSSTERGFLETESDKLLESLVQAAGMAEFSANELLLNDTGANNADGDDIAFSGVFQVGPNEGDTVTIETIRCHPDSLFDSGKKEVVTFEVSDANALAMNNSTIALNLAGTAVNLVLADGDDTVAEIVAKMNASADGTIAAYTYAAVGNTITATKDAVGVVANTGNTITMANSTVLTGDVTTQGSAANATADAILDFSTQAGCQDAITTIQNAYDKVAKNRAQLGAVQAQMESTIRNLANVVENTTAARSRIQDADFAAETAALTRAQMLQQAATSILAQANAQPQSVLELLQ
ncbi:flagellin [Luminiphilus sp.]|jgi:flagellin|nr:flagellin [Luminiphilus sp.]